MRFQYISDLHLEKVRNVIPKIKTSNVPLFLAGDIGNVRKEKYGEYLSLAANNWKHVFLVTGNHDYGGLREEAAFLDIDQKITELAAKIGNITFLNRKAVEYEGRIILGCTLWTHTTFVTNKRVETENIRHAGDMQFIEKMLNRAQDKEVIVMTHHLPSYCLIAPNMRAAFSTKLCRWASHSDYLIRAPVSTWICGHSHIVHDAHVGDVRVLINANGGEPLETKTLCRWRQSRVL